MFARVKPSNLTDWNYGRWRPIKCIRPTNDKQDCRGGGVPMGVDVIFYADTPKTWFETAYDFIYNVEIA